MGRRSPLRRFLCSVVACVLGGGAVAVHIEHAGALSPFTCPHFHAVYSYPAPGFVGMSNQIGVSGSTCTNGTAVGVSTFGGGWVTEVDAGPPLTGTARQNHYFLGLQVGGTSVQVSFDAVMVPFNDPVSPPDVPNPQLPIDFGLAGEVHFDNATGTGVMLETCTFDAASDVITCTDEGSFASD